VRAGGRGRPLIFEVASGQPDRSSTGSVLSEQIVHGICQGVGGCLGHFLGQDLIELPLEDLFGLASMHIRGLPLGGSHGCDELTEQGLADEVGERFP